MEKLALLFIIFFIGLVLTSGAQEPKEVDTITTSGGNLSITFIGHGTLMFSFGGKVIHIDPVSRYADYAALPKADLILVTHEHGDHLDPDAIAKIKTDATVTAIAQSCSEGIPDGIVMKNGDQKKLAGFTVDAVPAYNIVHKRGNGDPYHPKGVGNGYVITFADKRVYIAGDTENIPEMSQLKDIDITFLPMNLPYTMTPEMVADAARVFKPKILYPYHFGETDTSALVNLLKNDQNIEVRIRSMK
ncbi:hypothetical protein ES708_32123 [subsurface metagenome]